MLSTVAVYASIALVSLSALCWCHLPHCTGVFAQHCSCCGIVVVLGHHQPRQPTSPSVVVTSGIALALSPSWHWHLCCCCAGAITLVMLASACLQPHRCMWHRCCAGVIVVRGLVAINAVCNIIFTCDVVVALALFLCAASLPYTALPLLSVAADADLPCPLPLLQTAMAWAMPDIKAPHPFLVAFALPPLLPCAASLLFWCH
jgi:hypothetical protein